MVPGSRLTNSPRIAFSGLKALGEDLFQEICRLAGPIKLKEEAGDL
jgi:hypothetical protein